MRRHDRIIFFIFILASVLIRFGGQMVGAEVYFQNDSQSAGAVFREAVFRPEAAGGNEEVLVDVSSASLGYFGVWSSSDARLKMQVLMGEAVYVYDLVNGETDFFPFQLGDGTYTIRIMKNIEGSKYFQLYACEAAVALTNELDPFLVRGQYADYSEASRCVQKARELAGEAKDVNDFISKVYSLVCGNVSYDYEKAATIRSGYLPDPDETLNTHKGICFDYASLTASMLRSQGVPAKIIFGYVAPDDLYHAWNMFYTPESGWVTVEFQVSGDNWNRIDLTFSANGASSEFIGDGSNYMDIYEY